jgi:hypothetical protein
MYLYLLVRSFCPSFPVFAQIPPISICPKHPTSDTLVRERRVRERVPERVREGKRGQERG